MKLTVTSISGREALIGFYDGGHLLGESSLVPNHAVRFHNAIAMTDVQVSKIDRAAVLRRVSADPTVAYAFLSWALARNKTIQQELVNQLFLSSEQRLARVISAVAHVAVTDKTGIIPKLTQQDMANAIGVSRQHVNALLTRLKRSGVIDQNGGLKRKKAKAVSFKNRS